MREETKRLKIGTKEWFDKDEKVLFFTGIPNIEVLNAVFMLASGGLQESNKSALSLFQEFTLTLMRLRLNLTIVDLSYQFNISSSTTSALFLKWIDILFVRLHDLIKWSEREILYGKPLLRVFVRTSKHKLLL